MKVYNKLVRDLIPEIIAADGLVAKCQTLSENEYREQLFQKLVEEALEFKSKPSLEELADVLEVLMTITKLEGIDWHQLEEERARKRQERGGFEGRLLLVSVSNPAQ